MEDHKKKHEEIFPGLRNDRREESPPEQAQVHTSDWREKPLTTRGGHENRETLTPAGTKPPHQPKTGPLWLVFALLLVLLGGVSFLGYGAIRKAGIQMGQIPRILQAMITINGRLESVEGKIGSWAADLQNLSDRLGKLQSTVRSNYLQARKHAEVLTTQLEERINDQMDSRNYIVDTRLNQLETEQKSSQARFAQLQQQLSDAHRELAELRQETNGDLALLHQQVAGNNEQVNDLTQQVERRRVDFEVARNRQEDLSSEITMKLASTNVQYQRFSGWLYFLPDRRIVWIHNQGVQRPIVFYSKHESRQYQVVVTGVRKNSAVGYLLLPAQPGPAPQTVALAEEGK